MSTLDRYILKTFVRNLGLVLATLVMLYGLIEFLETVDDFIEYEASFRFYLLYPLSHLPVMLSNSLPMAVLLATFATIGAFSRTSQLTAIFSGGVSIARASRSLFIGGACLSLLALLANLWLIPWSNRESDFMLTSEIKGKTIHKASKKELYFRDGDRIISVNQAFPARGVVIGLTVLQFNDSFEPIARTQAERAKHLGDGIWLLKRAVSWRFDPQTRAVASFERYDELRFDLHRRPENMLQLWDKPEDLMIGELLSLTGKLQNEGYDARSYLVETQMRFARAVIPLIMVLIGLPFALQRGRDASFSRGIVTSLVIFVAYYVLYAVFAVFGTIDVLPPLAAAWAANILMALVGCWFFLSVRD